MAEIKQLKEGNKVIYPLTSINAIIGEDGNRLAIPTKTSELENDSSYITTERVEELIKGGNGVTIVSSVGELPSDAPHGSLATVSNIKTEEIEVEDKFSVRDIYVEENPDCEPLMELKLKVPETLPTEPFWFILGAKGYNNTNELIQGRYLGLVLMEGEFVTMVAENGSPILNMSPLVIDYSIDEEILTQVNEIISSWGGIVLYGSAGEGQELLTPTEAQIEAIDSFISYNNGTHIETVEIHTNDIYFKETTGWRKINDVKIVDSVDKLDKNAPQGSLATLTTNSIKEVSLSTLYQFTEEDMASGDMETILTTIVNKGSDIDNLNITPPTGPIVEENQSFIFNLVNFGDSPSIYTVEIFDGGCGFANPSTQEDVHLWKYNDGEIIVYEDGIAQLQDLVASGNLKYANGKPADNSEELEYYYSIIDQCFSTTISSQGTTLYIKDVEGWEEFSQVEIVDNLEEGGVDKALSAEMGKVLNEMISNISFSSGADAVTFKGYVNVDSKAGIDAIFDKMKVGDAVLCVPSTTMEEMEDKDSFLPWIVSGLNKNNESYRIPIAESLLSIDKSQFTIGNVANLIAGKGEIRTYFTLDAYDPYAVCPDLLLLAKVKANLKDFMVATDGISSTLINMIPDGTEMTACVGKVLRWSGGDWVAENRYAIESIVESMKDGILPQQYGWGYNMDEALNTGIIAYTDQAGNLPINNGGWYTVFVNTSTTVDHAGANTIQQIAYGRTGDSTGRVWTRLIFNNISSQNTEYLPWAEISNNNNILPNVNGWLLNPNECLNTGVYQTCNSGALNGMFTNNYFTMFVNASTSPNGDGYDAIEQTAYGREADEGKICRRVIFLNKTTNEKQYKEWRRIDEGVLYDFAAGLEGFITENFATKEEVQSAINESIINVINSDL